MKRIAITSLAAILWLGSAAGAQGTDQRDYETFTRWMTAQPAVVKLNEKLQAYSIGTGECREKLEEELAGIELMVATENVSAFVVERLELLRLVASADLMPSALRGEPITDLVGRTARLAARAHMAVGEVDAAREVLTELLPDEESWRRATGQVFAGDAPADVKALALRAQARTGLDAQLDAQLALPEHAALLERARSMQQGGAPDWLGEILEPLAAEWARAHLDVPSREVYDSVRQMGVSGGRAFESWQIASATIWILATDRWGANSTDVLFDNLCQTDPELAGELDALIAPREGLAWRRAAVSGASSALGRNTDEALVLALSPLVVRFLEDDRLIGDPKFKSVLRRVAQGPAFVPVELVEAWREAIRTGSVDDALFLISIWGAMPRDPWGDARPRFPKNEDWNRDVQAACLEHPASEIRLLAAPTFIGTGEGEAIYGWAGDADPRLRQMALERLRHRNAFSSWPIEPSSAEFEAVLQLVADPEPEIRGAAVEDVLGARNPIPAWLEAALEAATDEERLGLVERLVRLPLGSAWSLTLAQNGGLRARIAADPDPAVRAALVGGPWQTPETVSEVVGRAAADPAPEVRDAVDAWLEYSENYDGPFGEVLLARMRDAMSPFDLTTLPRERAFELVARSGALGELLGLALDRGDSLLRQLVLESLAATPKSAFSDPDRRPAIVDEVGLDLVIRGARGGWSSLAPEVQGKLAWRLAMLGESQAAIAADRTNPPELRWAALTQAPEADRPTAAEFLAMLDESLAGEKPFQAFPPAELRQMVRDSRLAGANPNLAAWLASHPAEPAEALWRAETRGLVYALLDDQGEGATEAATAILSDFCHSLFTGANGGNAIPDRLRSVVLAHGEDPQLIAELGRALRERPDSRLVGIAAAAQSEELIDPLGSLVEMSFDRLLELTRSTEGSVRSELIIAIQQTAASGLRRFPGNPRANEALRRGMLQGSERLRDTCAGVLESHAAYLELEQSSGQVETVAGAKARLFAMLKGDDAAQAAEAARALATIGAVEALPDLIGALAHPDAGVRAAARESIDRLNAREPLREAPAVEESRRTDGD
ncbi:hypothetical protein [Engelhardtia mirabilis]|uniref:HEAT repeat protein n=1 Tax=Engelhardtia mirabilis TaxID=2528011 RepID=A0A518BI75_9BACT|nr:hypothetical protein Pla133_17480 [Planctomycetes bacterium Pla133]QDV00998.1 hypothetical protein Pla86_17470 [Planctomycetes bacterium Pla86]